jgi:hypothetical protein
MPNYVPKEHFDAAIGHVRNELHGEVGSVRSELTTFRNEIMDRLDGMTVILKRLDQGRVFTIEWIRRIESDVSMVKKHLKLA